MKPATLNPKLDLVLERTIDVPPELVWKAWTTPELLMPWFCPLPWKTVDCKIDLRPGGEFSTTMQSPEGGQYPNTGCYLEIIPGKKLMWTDALHPGYRPALPGRISGEIGHMTAIILLEPTTNGGSKYAAIAMHTEEKYAKKHEEMGFSKGWGMALDQLVAYMKQQPR
jgi:uncharacterized protein YndB with AHSA1/START domain